MLNKVLFAILAMVMVQSVVGVPTPLQDLPCASISTGFVTSSFAELVGLLLDIDHDIRQFSHAKTRSGGGIVEASLEEMRHSCGRGLYTRVE
ncbi:hypothetical protein B0H14DRAFT_1102108 [Mycena olivaceomarginata]|nr:hypothetical protein B0H14DRAFT_1102108 [Mycena olivaceomarginata]